MPTKTIESLGLTLTDDLRAVLANADVIIGVDVQTQCEFTVFGIPPLESTVSFKKPSAMNIVKVRIDGNASELDALAKLVSAIKGRPGNPA